MHDLKGEDQFPPNERGRVHEANRKVKYLDGDRFAMDSE